MDSSLWMCLVLGILGFTVWAFVDAWETHHEFEAARRCLQAQFTEVLQQNAELRQAAIRGRNSRREFRKYEKQRRRRFMFEATTFSRDEWSTAASTVAAIRAAESCRARCLDNYARGRWQTRKSDLRAYRLRIEELTCNCPIPLPGLEHHRVGV